MSVSSSLFVAVGDRVEIFQRPYTCEDSEGCAVVLELGDPSDSVSAYVRVRVDGDPADQTVWRWVLPEHVKPPSLQLPIDEFGE